MLCLASICLMLSDTSPAIMLLLQINSISSPDARAFCLGNLLLMYVLRTRQAGMQSCGMLPASWMVVSGLQCLPTNSTVASWTDRGTTGANHGFRLQAQNVVLHCHCRSWFASQETCSLPLRRCADCASDTNGARRRLQPLGMAQEPGRRSITSQDSAD